MPVSAKYKVPDNDFNKYNVPMCYEVAMTREVLDEIRDNFQELRGLPGFVDHLLHLKQGSEELALLSKHPHAINWTPDGTGLIIPDLPYLGAEKDARLAQGKNAPDGLSLNVWYVHPTLLEKSIFSNPEMRTNFQEASKHVSYASHLEGVDEFAREKNRQTIREIQDESGIPYLASPTDITPKDLPWLKSVRDTVQKHLRDQYGVNANDKVDIFLHTINDRKTATVHFHVRVNQGVHPLEERKRLHLDDIIAQMEKGKTVKDMIVERGHFYPASDELRTRRLQHLKISKIPNPCYIPAQHTAFAARINQQGGIAL